jgi:hypothetical protein
MIVFYVFYVFYVFCVGHSQYWCSRGTCYLRLHVRHVRLLIICFPLFVPWVLHVLGSTTSK